MKIKVAIFASGSGTNAEKIFQHFQGHPSIDIALLLSNNHKAFALQRAENYNIPTAVFNRQQLYHSNYVVDLLLASDISFVVLAGFMWLVPQNLLKAFPNKIVNIHPALLPKYGGKGMYGMHVHQAVVENGEVETGITIHFVDENYDEGDIIKQAKCEINPGETADEVAKKVHELEYEHYPSTIEMLVGD